MSNNSIRILINHLEKIKLFDKKITLTIAEKICTNIGFCDFKSYTNILLKKRYY